jgi:hypothetical protein
MILLSLPTGRQAVLKQTVKKQSRVALFLVILLGTQKKNPGVGWNPTSLHFMSFRQSYFLLPQKKVTKERWP